MSHSFSLISTLAIGFAIAWMLGFVMERIKVPALVGYLLAGIIISPTTPGFVGDVGIAGQLSEIGVMLLMFGVGLHFSLTDLLRVKKIAVPGAILQMGLATVLGALLAH
ncbi:cation:proton antiporter, partial [uncultured Parasutterella sp.]